MQQPISQQHDQIGGQQISQPMVLCPVRFVYETQILVQPGDHIQPNQTFFINAQNPPPWVQNTLQRQAISSPVVYVQQLPNNIVSTVQQPMDQNQLYLQQNFANFQMQQQMLAQTQDMRSSMQIANIMPNMVQNIQAQTSVDNDRVGQHNAQMQANGQMMQVQVNRSMQNQINPMEVTRQVMMRPQVHQQTNTPRPMMPMNQVQNVQQQTATLPNVAQNSNHTMATTGRPSPNMNIVRAPAPNNVVSVQPLPKIREITPSDVNRPTNSPHLNIVPNARNFVPNYYRPIQPRPQTSHNVANIPKPQQHIPVQTVQSTPMYNQDRSNIQQNANNNHAIIQQLNNPANRKRKSESPDEIQNKMTVNTNKNNQQQQSMTITKVVNEIGTNTSPVHKPRVNTQFKISSPLNAAKTGDIIIENLIKEAMMPDKDKLVRNTVFTQARGRVLQDKIEEIKPIESPKENKTNLINIAENRVVEAMKIDVKDIPKVVAVNRSVQIENVANINKNVTETIPNDFKEDHPKSTDIVVKHEINNKNNTPETKHNFKENINENNNKNNTSETKPDNFKENINNTDSPNHVSNHVDIVLNYVTNPEVAVAPTKDITADKSSTNEDAHLTNKKEDKLIKADKKEANNKTIQQENINILTHVVDGYVIQESNVAFPIRKPLKEKTIHTNLKSGKSEAKDLIRESIKEELKNNVDIPLLPFHYLMLDNAKEEKKVEEVKVEEVKVIEEQEDEPFAKLQHSTVKEWTVEDVCNHLLKFDWKETVSLFHEHEIDGESLLLASKQHLITIGVKEDHADIISEFVKG